MVEIAKALSLQLRILILDEPTSALTITEERRRLLASCAYLANRGVAVVYISTAWPRSSRSPRESRS